MNTLLLMAGPREGGGQGGSILPYAMMWGLIVFIFYFFMIRPQKRKQAAAAKMLEELKRGDRVVTSSGIYGTIVGVKENVAVLKIADQVKVEMAKSAIAGVVEKAREA